MYICVLCACLVTVEVREDTRFPESGVMNDCNLPCGYLELNLDPLQKHLSPLTAELVLQAYLLFFKIFCLFAYLFRGTHIWIEVSKSCGSQFSPSTVQVLGVKLHLSGLVVSAFTCWAISSLKWVICCDYWSYQNVLIYSLLIAFQGDFPFLFQTIPYTY